MGRFGELRSIGAALGDAARLSKGYFVSEERRVAWGLLATIIALNLFLVYLNVVYTYWYKIAYNALEAKTASVFWASMFTYQFVHGFPYFVPGFAEIAILSILAGVYAFYLGQMLDIRWRRWLTLNFVKDWLDRRAYYHISLQAKAGTPLDNPDQRIAEDLRDFVSSNLTLGISLLSNVVTLLSFVGVLWTIGPPLAVGHVLIPGYLVWAAVFYSIAGTYFTQRIGRQLIPLNFTQQQVNADFRFNLVRVREHTEQIALSHGEREEANGLNERFRVIYENWWRIMKRTKALNFFTIGFTQIAIIFPLVVAAPGYFSGIFTLGVLLQIAAIFGNVQGALSWFITAYPALVIWRATVQRLDGFERAVRDAHAHAASSGLTISIGGPFLRIEQLAVDLPDGRRLLEQDHLAVSPGGPLAITGQSGIGKSTLFRVIAGIWPFARGRIEYPTERVMFLPQHPYFPLGSLKRATTYPLPEQDVSDEIVRAALDDVGLGALAERLNEVDQWALRLSGGEQQRLALARALITAPVWLFMDEAMSALDEPAATALFALLRRRLPGTQVVSIAHQEAIVRLHGRHAALVRNGGDSHGIIAVETHPAVRSSA